MLQRAYSLLDIKGIDEETRTITGIASTPEVDRMGDILEPKGAEFTLPIPLLWQHNTREPIGEVIAATVTPRGIEIKATMPIIAEAGSLRDRIDTAWQSMKAGLVKGLSVGFSGIETAPIKGSFGVRFTKWSWLELSAVTIPANASATIATVKSLDVGAPAPSRSSSAGVTATSRVVMMRSENPMKKTYADQIAGWEATRKAKTDRMDDILAKSSDSGVTLDQAEAEEHDTLADELKSIDATLVRLKAAEQREKDAAAVVTEKQASGESRAVNHPRITIEKKLPPGIAFARYAMCIGAAKGITVEAMRLAKQHYPDDGGVLKLIEKAPVAGGSTTGSHYLDDMVPYNVMNDFIEYLRPGSIIGKFGGPNPGGGPNYPSLNRVGFNERVSGMSTGFTAAWVGEGLPALPSAAVTYNDSLLFNKLCALAILTKEAIRFSNPSAEAKVRDDLARAVNAKMDLDFIDPAKAVSGTTSPASITNGIAATAPTGTTAAFFRTNLATMLRTFTVANLGTGGLVLIMSETMGVNLSMMINTLGNSDFPNVNGQGGSISGIPVITSEHLTAVGSPSTQMIVAVKANEIYLADDGQVTVEASDQASIEMQSTSSQSGITGTGASLVSLWQSGLVGLMAQREITWKRRRSTAVAYISPAAYTP